MHDLGELDETRENLMGPFLNSVAQKSIYVMSMHSLIFAIAGVANLTVALTHALQSQYTPKRACNVFILIN